MHNPNIPEADCATPNAQPHNVESDTKTSGLFNDENKTSIADNEAYHNILLEQWCTANELTAHISEQRNNINNFYTSLLSLLIGGLLVSERIAAGGLASRTVFLLVILVLAIFCCITWIRQIEKCKRINYQKFQIIAQLEQRLPANVLSYEDKIDIVQTDKKRTFPRKTALSDYEKKLATVFCVAISLIVAIMLIEMWWNPLCNLIR